MALKSTVGMHLRFNDRNFEFKDKSFKVDWHRYERNVDGGDMRLILETPAGSKYKIGDLFDKTTKSQVRFGSQFASFVTVKLPLLITKSATSHPEPQASASESDKLGVRGFVLGRDAEERTLEPSFTKSELTDYLGVYLAEHGSSKILTAENLIDTLEKGTWAAFVAYDALGLPLDIKHGVAPRVLFVCVPNSEKAKDSKGDINVIREEAFNVQTMLIVCDRTLDSKTAFLQAACFDPQNRWFNFYHRIGTPEKAHWQYHGCSKDAFEQDSRYLGPFCGHVNGALVMKELKSPWSHWISSKTRTLGKSLPNTDAIWRQTKLLGERLKKVQHADNLEPIIIEGVDKW